MSHQVEFVLSRLDRLIIRLWLVVLCVSLLNLPRVALGQTGCTTYNECASLQGESSTKLTGNITYSFDEASLSLLSSDEARQNFRSRVQAAAADWAQRTGRSVTAAPSGQTGNVTVRINNTQPVRDDNGVVTIDPANSARRIIEFSDEFNGFSTAGQQRLTSHEWGHIFGLRDVAPDGCSGVSTIMRQLGTGAILADAQLRNGYTCETSGGPGTCSPDQNLPQPPEPTSCDASKAQSLNPTPTPTPENCTRTSSGCPIYYRWRGYPTCECVPSPVLVDVNGDGFALSNAADGVYFDLDADNTPERRAWTLPGSDDAWLALDRNGNGTIDGGAELFGDRTPQPIPPAGVEMNGFLALAEFDRPGQGGDGNGWIDSHDAIFSRLRLWQDANHNGVSEPNELHTLASLQVVRFELDYKESKRVDEHGNEFGYRAKVRDARGAQAGHWAWDVFLVGGP